MRTAESMVTDAAGNSPLDFGLTERTAV